MRRVVLAHDERGQSLVEFALVLPILMLLLVGTVDVARAFQSSVALGNAVREAARDAIVRGSESSTPWGPSANDAAVTTAVRSRAVGLVAQDITVTSSWPAGNNGRGSEVQIQATYTFRPIASTLLGGVTIPLAAGTRARIQR